KFKLPAAAPGPVPALPAINVRPRGIVGPVGGKEAATLLSSTIREAALNVLSRLISRPAHISRLPSVVETPARLLLGSAPVFADLTIFTSRPALNNTFPPVLGVAATPVLVISAFTLMSRPQQTTRLPRVVVTAALIFTSPAALNVSVAVVTGVHVSGVATVILPRPDAGIPGTPPLFVVVIVTSVPPP